MTTYRTKDCDCPPVITGVGGKRPEPCEAHGERYLTEAQLRSTGVGADPIRPLDASQKRGDARGVGADPSAHRKRRKPMKRREPKRDWTLARQKIDEEGGCCRVCGAFSAEAAHIMGRKFDQPISPGSKTLLVLPDRIVPLCNERFGHGCHERYDAHELDLAAHLTAAEQAQAVLVDLAAHLTAAEQAQAVLDAGSIGLALSRISGPERVFV